MIAEAEHLRRGELAEVGALLTESHAFLRDDCEVSWPEADAIVDAAIAAGAAGVRMIGGGFGGSVLALLPAAQDELVKASVVKAFGQHNWPPPASTTAVPSDSTGIIL